jgi:hypothetical protein
MEKPLFQRRCHNNLTITTTAVRIRAPCQEEDHQSERLHQSADYAKTSLLVLGRISCVHHAFKQLDIVLLVVVHQMTTMKTQPHSSSHSNNSHNKQHLCWLRFHNHHLLRLVASNVIGALFRSKV